jgi:predicted GIY-YIG superfamily endonuclease
MFFVYMLKCADDSFYVGHTDNLETRLARHDQGYFPSCYTFARRPVQYIYSQEFETRDEALSMEKRIKGWSRAKKSALAKHDWAEISRISQFKYGRRDKGGNT